MHCWKLIISGRVQGVGFRYTIYEKVKKEIPEVVGYVKNLPDGKVEVIGQGTLSQLKILEKLCQKGAMHGRVDYIEIIRDYEVNDLDTFMILRS